MFHKDVIRVCPKARAMGMEQRGGNWPIPGSFKQQAVNERVSRRTPR